MPEYRRLRNRGATVFLTVVVHERYPLFFKQEARRHLRAAIVSVRKELPFSMTAICLLPDHFHLVMTLPTKEMDYSKRIQKVKSQFTASWLESGGWEGNVSASRRSKGERGVWQRRFWEHTVRDEQDLERCVDYVHWNPCKHGVVQRVCDYPHSTFHRYVAAGYYGVGWGSSDPCGEWNAAEFIRE
ncbi:MAG: transposase [Planctomycetota bacterium]